MKIGEQDRPVGVSHHRAEQGRSMLRPCFVPLTEGLSMNRDVRIPRGEILDNRATRYGV